MLATMRMKQLLTLLILVVLCVIAMVVIRQSMNETPWMNDRSSILGWHSSKKSEPDSQEGSGNVAVTQGPSQDLPTLFVITPTYPRMEQLPELTRLSQTLMLVPKLIWIVVEDADEPSGDVVELLSRIRLPNVHLLGPMPEVHRKGPKLKEPKGVANRLAGIDWIKENADDSGVMYLADDDNSYDIRLFEEIRYTKKVSMFPVGLVANLGVSTPIVRKGKVVGFYDGWIVDRKFPVDMAGFAVNVGYLKSKPNATMPYVPGYEEDGFLKSLEFSMDEIEPLADDCKKVLVWHTQTKHVEVPRKMTVKQQIKYWDTNLPFIPHTV